MQNVLYREIWVNTAMIQTLLMCMLDVPVTWTNPIFYSWERLLKTELLQRMVGAWLWQLSSFPPQRSAKLFGAAAVLWLGSHVDTVCQCNTPRPLQMLCEEAKCSDCSGRQEEDVTEPQASQKSWCAGNGTCTALLAEVGWGIKNMMWTTPPC